MKKDDHNEPLHAYIEPEIEARLTALVLGEASDFEREEMERLIDERPELGVFRRRLEAIHGLLREVGSGESVDRQEEWKLSGDRRKALLETIGGGGAVMAAPEVIEDGEPGEGPSIDENAINEVPATKRGTRVKIFLQIAAVVMAMALLISMLMPASSGILKSARKSADDLPAGDEFLSSNSTRFFGDREAKGRSLSQGDENEPVSLAMTSRENLDDIRQQLSFAFDEGARGRERSERITDEALSSDLPSLAVADGTIVEQFGVGGYGAVRGYESKAGGVRMDMPDEGNSHSLFERDFLGGANNLRGFESRNVNGVLELDEDDSKLALAAPVESRSGSRARIEVKREFLNPTEYDPPEIPTSFETQVDGEVAAVSSFPMTPATPLDMLEEEEIHVASKLTGLGWDVVKKGEDGEKPADDAVSLGAGGFDTVRVRRPSLASSAVDAKVSDAGREVEVEVAPGGKLAAVTGNIALSAGGETMVPSVDESSVEELQTVLVRSDELGEVVGADQELKAQGNHYAMAINSTGAVRASGATADGGVISLGNEVTTVDASGAVSGGNIQFDGGGAVTGGGAAARGEESARSDLGRGGRATASRYVLRQEEVVQKADEAALRGAQLLSDGDLEGAAAEYRTATDLLPDAPMLKEREKIYSERFAQVQNNLSRELAEKGRYGEAIDGLAEVLVSKAKPARDEAMKLLGEFEDPEFFAPAMAPDHVDKLSRVKKALKKAENYAELGELNRAREEYDKVLNDDAYNSDARRGLNWAEKAEVDYYDRARDETRSSFAQGIAEGWELPVPAGINDTQWFAATGTSTGEVASPGAVGLTPLEAKAEPDEVADSPIRTFGSGSLELPKGWTGGGQDQEGPVVAEDKGDQSREHWAFWGGAVAGGDIDRESAEFKTAQHEWHPGDADGDGLIPESDELKAILDLVPHVVGGGRFGSEEKKRKSRLHEGREVIGADMNDALDLDYDAQIEPEFAASYDMSEVEGIVPVAPPTSAGVPKPPLYEDFEIDLSIAPEVVEFSGFINYGSPITSGLRSEAKALDADSIDALIAESEGEGVGEAPAVFGLAGVFTDPEFQMIRRHLNEDSRKELPAGLEELTAEEESFSTFSLHVSDVSFKLAQASLAKGEWPDSERIRIEEFVNAFDYGDPLPNQEAKVSCQVEQGVHPFLQQRNLLRVSMRTAEMGRSLSTPLRLTLLLDNSGSMERSDRQETIRRAFAQLATQLQPTDEVTLISFARQPRLLADAVKGNQAAEWVSAVSQLPSEGGTNLESALELAFEKAKEHQEETAQSRIILLTDGAANLGNAKPESLATLVESMRNAGIAFDAAGIGAEGLNDEILEALTRKGDGRYYLLDRPEDADAGFARQIAGAFRPAAKNVKVQMEFNPERVGHYKLLGFEKHRLEKEDFRDDSVDAAEMASAESGVAVYQVEPNPEGDGDIGSVSVRFRDMATGKMVEKRWPIPFEPQAARPDLAPESFRVAAIASQFAAKLKGGPLGDLVDLDELSQLVSTLPESSEKSDRIGQLREMIEQARQLSQP